MALKQLWHCLPASTNANYQNQFLWEPYGCFYNSKKYVPIHISISDAVLSNLMILLIWTVTLSFCKLHAAISKCFIEEVQKYSSHTDWTDISKFWTLPRKRKKKWSSGMSSKSVASRNFLYHAQISFNPIVY